MKKKIIIGLVVVITVMYGVVGAILFSDIQLLKAPETTVTLSIVEINETKAVFNGKIEITNPNSFDLITKDFELILYTDTGGEVGNTILAGGIIPPNGKKTFMTTIPIGFPEQRFDLLHTRLSGVVGMNIFGIIKKTLPITITIITSIDDILQQLQAPQIHISVDLSDISEHGIHLTSSFDVYNPNSFDLSIDDFSTNIRTETDDTVGTMLVHGGVLHGKQSTVLQGDGQIRIEALNAKMLTMNVPVAVGVQMAGLNKSLTIDMDTQISMPDLDTLFSSNKPLDLVIFGDYKVTRSGVLVNVTLEIINPHNLTLLAKNLSVTIFEVTNDQKMQIGFGTINDGVVPAQGNIRLQSEILLPRTRIFSALRGLISSDWLLTTVRGNFSIPGLEKNFWFGISGYEDLHPFQ